jgi:hypothetical protein
MATAVAITFFWANVGDKKKVMAVHATVTSFVVVLQRKRFYYIPFCV